MTGRRYIAKSRRRAWDLYKRLRHSIRAGRGTTPPTVLVVGNQRSGTNMLMNVLDRSVLTDVFHERDPRAFTDYEMRDLNVIEKLRAESSADFFVIKALCELHKVPALLDELAPARAVWLFRHYHDVTNSMTRSFIGFKQELASIAEDPTSAGWRGQGMSADTQQRIRQIAALDFNEADAAATQWYFRNVLFFDSGLQQDPRVMAVRYEHLVANPKTMLTRIVDFLSIPLTDYMHKPVVASSIGKNPAPVLLPEVESLCASLWERIEDATPQASAAKADLQASCAGSDA